VRRSPRKSVGLVGRRRPTSSTSDAPAPDQVSMNVLQVLSVILPPGALVIALGFWFGLNLTDSRAAYFGLDASSLGFTTTDYVARSPDAAFVPVAVVLICWLALIALHAGVSYLIRSGHSAVLFVAARATAGVGIVALGIAVWMMFRPLPFRTHYLLPPLLLAAAVGMIGYGAWVAQRIGAKSEAEVEQRLPRWAYTGRIVVVMLVVLSLFWAASLYARALGNGRAATLAANLDQRPSVTIFSKESLAIAADGVVAKPITEPESAYRFRYDGLKLLVRSGDKYFLLPQNWTRKTGVALVIRDTPDIRVEFGPGGRS
jgi:hypothetical protein